MRWLPLALTALALVVFAALSPDASAGSSDAPPPPAPLPAPAEDDPEEVPDPWIEIALQCEEGRFADAEATAAASASAGPDCAGLPAFVQARRSGTPCFVRSLEALAERAGTCAEEGRQREAGDLLEAAAEAAEKGGWLSRAAALWPVAANHALDALDFSEQRARLERLVTLQARREDDAGLGAGLFDLGQAHMEVGACHRALDYLARAEEAFLRAGRGRLEDSVASLLREAQGGVLLELGRYGEALVRLEEAATRCPVDDPEGQAVVMMQKSTVLVAVGQHDEALRCLEVADRIFVTREDAEGSALVEALRGTALLEGGRIEEARGHFRRAGPALDAAGNARAAAQARGNVAECDRILGQPGPAVIASREVARYWESIGDELSRAEALGTVASALSDLGSHAEAMAEADRAVTLSKEHGTAERTEELLRRRAEIRLRAGMYDGAMEDAAAVLRECERRAAGLTEEVYATSRAGLDVAVRTGALAALVRRDAVGVLRFLEAGRALGIVMALGRGRRVLDGLGTPVLAAEVARIRDEEGEAMHALRLASAAGELAAVRAAAERVEAAHRRRRAVAEESRRSLGFEPVEPRPGSEDRVALMPGEVLVEYAVVRLPARNAWDRVLAVVVDGSGTRAFDLGAADPVLAACAAMEPDTPAEDLERHAATLRARLVEPLGLAPEVERLLISPDGPLWRVPTAILFPGKAVAVIPSTAVLAILRASNRTRGSGILALGDPAYSVGKSGEVASARLSSGDAVPARLPHTRAEVESIGTEVLVGDRATRVNLLRMLASRERWAAVHLACHARADEECPSRSALHLAPAAGDAGVLTVLDLWGMRIPADLAVLSACDGARGKVHPGEGILGLARAFMQAGVPRIVASLWSADDGATAALMRRFHERLSMPGVGTAQALRDAQEWTKAQDGWSHPRFWAGWVLLGLPE
jgi:tetratricopeptide (TPR) repeat protein